MAECRGVSMECVLGLELAIIIWGIRGVLSGLLVFVLVACPRFPKADPGLESGPADSGVCSSALWPNDVD